MDLVHGIPCIMRSDLALLAGRNVHQCHMCLPTGIRNPYCSLFLTVFLILLGGKECEENQQA